MPKQPQKLPFVQIASTFPTYLFDNLGKTISHFIPPFTLLLALGLHVLCHTIGK